MSARSPKYWFSFSRVSSTSLPSSFALVTFTCYWGEGPVRNSAEIFIMNHQNLLEKHSYSLFFEPLSINSCTHPHAYLAVIDDVKTAPGFAFLDDLLVRVEHLNSHRPRHLMQYFDSSF